MTDLPVFEIYECAVVAVCVVLDYMVVLAEYEKYGTLSIYKNNLDHRGWSEKMSPQRGPNIKKRVTFALQLIVRRMYYQGQKPWVVKILIADIPLSILLN